MVEATSSAIDVFDIVYVLPFLASLGLLVFLLVIVQLLRRERDEVLIIKTLANLTAYTITGYILCNVIMVAFRFLNHVSLVVLLPTIASSLLSLTGSIGAYHPLMRAIFTLVQPLILTGHVYQAVIIHGSTACIYSGRCPPPSESLLSMQVALVAHSMGVFFAMIHFFSGSYMMIAMGVCINRYSLRTLDDTKKINFSYVKKNPPTNKIKKMH